MPTKVPAVSLNSGIVDLTLAATLIEVLEDDTRRKRLIVWPTSKCLWQQRPRSPACHGQSLHRQGRVWD